MLKITPTGETLGATVEGVDLAKPLDRRDFAAVLCQRRWKTRPQAGARVGQFRAAFSDCRAWVTALGRALPI